MTRVLTEAHFQRIMERIDRLEARLTSGIETMDGWVPLSALRKRLGHRYHSSTNAHIKANPDVYVMGDTLRCIDGRYEVLLAEVMKRLEKKPKRGRPEKQAVCI